MGRETILGQDTVRRFFTVLFLTLYIGNNISAQLSPEGVDIFNSAKNGLVLLCDEAALLPFGRLDTLRPALATIGDAPPTLLQTLNTYQPTASWAFRGKDQWEISNPEVWGTGQANLLLVAIDNPTKERLNNALLEAASKTSLPIVVMVMGWDTPSFLSPESSQTYTILFSTQRTEWAYSLAAQALYGAVGLQKKLPYAWKGFPAGSGIAIKDNGRLAFAPAATVGMNAKLLEDSIPRIVRQGLEAGAYPGAQVLVARNGVVVYHEAFGVHSAEHPQPVTLTDMYDLASITKISSALPMLMKWYGEGRFNPDTTLQTYYPKAAGSNKANLTFREMLSHEARLRAWIPFWQGTLKSNARYPWEEDWNTATVNNYQFRAKTFARDSSRQYPIKISGDLWEHKNYQRKIIAAILASPLNEKPGYVYSDLSLYLLPEVVQNIGGQDFETTLRQNLYHPMGAYTMRYNPYKTFSLDRIIPTERDTFFRMTTIHGMVHDEGAIMMGGISGHAGLFANAYDLAKLMQMYLNGGRYGDQQLISPEAVREFTSYQYPERGSRRGLGFDKPLLEYDAAQSTAAEAASPASFGHSGFTGTFTWADPANGLLYIFLSNRVYPTRQSRALYELNIRSRIHAVLYEAVREE